MLCGGDPCFLGFGVGGQPYSNFLAPTVYGSWPTLLFRKSRAALRDPYRTIPESES